MQWCVQGDTFSFRTAVKNAHTPEGASYLCARAPDVHSDVSAQRQFHEEEDKMAAALEKSYIEICGFERETQRRYREVTVNLGLNSLPGGKFPDSAGAFHYEESGKLLSVTSNRFIHWSTCGDTVQLVELSLDMNLLNNGVKLKFSHCSVLPGGSLSRKRWTMSSSSSAPIRASTDWSCPTPRACTAASTCSPSSQTSANSASRKDPTAPPSQRRELHLQPQHATCWISHTGEAHYALASPAGGITVVTLPPHDAQGSLSVLELKRSSMMRRISGWMPTVIRGEQTSDLVLSLAVRELEDDTFIFALCQDHKLRMWSSGSFGLLSSTGLCLCVYLAFPQSAQFTVLQLVATDNQRYSLEHISNVFSTQETLVDFALTSTEIWGLWLDDTNSTVVKYIQFEHNVSGLWNQVFTQPAPEDEVHIGIDQDPRETYLDVLFSPLSFTAAAIVKALQIFRRSSDRITDLSWESLKREVTVAVETELQSSVTEFEFSQEEYRQLQVEFWSKFYACVLQYQEALSMPLALTGFVSFLLPCFAVDHLHLSYDKYMILEEETPIAEAYEMEKAHGQCCNENVIEDIQTTNSCRIPQSLQTPHSLSLSFSGTSTGGANVSYTQGRLRRRVRFVMTKGLSSAENLFILQKLFPVSVFLGGGAWLLQLQQDLIPRSSHLVVVVSSPEEHFSDSGTRLSLSTSFLSPQTVVELFYQTVARKSIISQIYSQRNSEAELLQWSHMISSVVQLLGQSLWPSNPGFQFPECLMSNCQYTQLQEYVRLVGPWCQVNIGSCRFMLGQCYLNTGEGQKALQCFQEAANEVEKEEFLMKLTGTEDEEAAPTARLQYYNNVFMLQVLRLLEDVGLPELVIQLSTVAITEAANDTNSQLLYAFHIQRHNYRKAGTVMFELGMRLAGRCARRAGLQRQVNCYCRAELPAPDSPEYAWIVQPKPGATYERPGASPKRNSDGEFTEAEPVGRQVDILELSDLEKEYLFSFFTHLSFMNLTHNPLVSLQSLDAAALLRLYLNFDLLESAAELVLEYVDAVLGRGHQYFGIEKPLSATGPLVWLPYTAIDQLLQTLSSTQTNTNIYNKLRDKLDDYQKLVEQATKRRLLTRTNVS
ncbi:hypothetical protein WMY93_026944 [Mugilogobius chulae]|uniref:Nuclear pore complex protein Nup160 n=1 Tax=Mugilogobius chulae TaxID=88201 RepID=A0AAW0MSJ9_9GOBI